MLEKQTLRIIKDPPRNMVLTVYRVSWNLKILSGYRESTFAHGLGACASAAQSVKQIAANGSGTFQRRAEIWFRYRQDLKPTTKFWCQGVLHRQSSLIEGVHKALYLQHVWNQNSIRWCQSIIESAMIWSLCFDFLGSPATLTLFMIELLMPQILYHLGCTEKLCVNTNIGTNYHSQLIRCISAIKLSNSISRPFNILRYCRLVLLLSPRVNTNRWFRGGALLRTCFSNRTCHEPWPTSKVFPEKKRWDMIFPNWPFLGMKLRDTQNWIAYMYVHIVHVHSKYIQYIYISMSIHII